MPQATTPSPAEQARLLTRLTLSRDHLLARAAAAELAAATLRELANTEISLTLDLAPMPLDAGAHVRAAHEWARPYLERLTAHAPAHLVAVDEAHSYTPRKILRRVLDHALDHLNQIEQWLAWQRQGVAPTPTDGWATSAQTFPEDLSPVSPRELDSWLWRIDVTVALLARRADALTAEQLDWIPPAGGWTLRQMLRHAASAERYYVLWLDAALPDEPTARYRQANQRFVAQWRRVVAHPPAEGATLFSAGDAPTTAEQVVEALLAAEETAIKG
jgi:DinB superfamily